MSIQRDPDGRRSVRVEVEVPGTPEQVWQAIASGPGITAWFVPTTVEPKPGGTMTCDFGGGMTSNAKIQEWQPPHRFTAESEGWAPGMPALATEWTVEARRGGTCLVRVVHSLFASTDDWDGQLTGTESGWPSFFAVLRRYLGHFAGQPSAQVLATAMTSEPIDGVWKRLCAALGTPSPRRGQRFRAEIAPGVTLAGELDRVDPQGEGHSMLAKLDQPAPGTLCVGAFACGGVMASMQTYFYGKTAAAIAGEAKPIVQQWLGGMFPPAKT